MSYQLQLLIFALVQTAFVLLDLCELWRRHGRPRAWAVLTDQRPLLFFLVLVWGGYFAIQNSLLALLPSLETTLVWLAEVLALTSVTPTVKLGLSSYLLIAIFLFITYFVAAFFDYALHRWVLHHRRGWFLHEAHHLPTLVCNGMPGISVRPFVAVTIFLTYAGTSAVLLGALKLIGQEWLLHWYLAHLSVLLLLFTTIGSASHSCFLRRYWRVHRALRLLLLTTPQEHILHHTTRGDCNYGNFVTCWDRVFGTYVQPLPVRDEDLQLGLAYDQDFLGALCRGRWKLSPGVRARYRLNRICRLTDAQERGDARQQ